MSSEIAIQVSKLGKRYKIFGGQRDRLLQYFWGNRKNLFREKWALKNASFSVSRGETVGVIGRNGSGKSTLLQLICGTLEPTEGQVKTNGRIAALLELGAGFNPEFTGRENVRLAAALYGLSRQQIDARIGKIVDFSEIGDYFDQPVKFYSSGMYVRLAFSVIAHVDADILIVDEALSVGDAFFTQKCMRFLDDFMKRGTIFFVSHDSFAVSALCKRVIWLKDGAVQMDGPTKSVMEQYLASIYDEASIAQSSSEKYEGQKAFGHGGAHIDTVVLSDSRGQALKLVKGGENIRLEINCTIHQPLMQPILGFLIKNRFGQVIFGDNTSRYYPKMEVRSGNKIQSVFAFVMPILPAGEYVVAVAIADGTQHSHVQHHWVHDALQFASHPKIPCQGLIGVENGEVTLKILN